MSAATYLKEANFIAGAWVGADSGETIDVTNPATGEVLGTVPACGAAETTRAIDARLCRHAGICRHAANGTAGSAVEAA